MDELISVIVPVYKVEEYLRRCIDSIINQTYKNLEIILVDDGSPDNCGKICDEYAKKDGRIKVIHKENGGLSDARNVGIEKSFGEYITFIDSDDYVESNYISVLYDLIKRYNTQISVADNFIEYVDGYKFNNSIYSEYVTDPKHFFEKMLWGIRDLDNGAWTKLYKKELFKDIQFPVGKHYEDTATIYKVVNKCEKIAVKSIPIYHYMKRRGSITQGHFNEKKLELIFACEQLTDFIKKEYTDLSEACDRKMLWAYFSILSQYAISEFEDDKIKNNLVTYIKNNRLKVFKYKMTPKRDRLAIICSLFGYKFYKFSWAIYLKFTKKY